MFRLTRWPDNQRDFHLRRGLTSVVACPHSHGYQPQVNSCLTLRQCRCRLQSTRRSFASASSSTWTKADRVGTGSVLNVRLGTGISSSKAGMSEHIGLLTLLNTAPFRRTDWSYIIATIRPACAQGICFSETNPPTRLTCTPKGRFIVIPARLSA